MDELISRQAAINMCRISRILNVSMDELMGDDNDSSGCRGNRAKDKGADGGEEHHGIRHPEEA